jgi:hypothetical protein
MNFLDELADKWATEAKTLRERYYDDKGAKMCEDKRAELLQTISNALSATLNLTQAGKESGYHPGHLGRLVKEGKLKNYGSPLRPKVRRGDLPRKPRNPLRESDAIQSVGTTRPEIARAVVNS